ncbi:MAG: Hpt domain-containing protein [Alphaproteobacteria bacterium]|nr:MAG: Hpt domain-containing protein [Alphaproteobacteria bacterium]
MIDWNRVQELRDEVGAEDFDDVVEVFLAEMDEIMERLGTAEEAVVSSDELHFLKGSALNLGFRALGALCADSEQALRESAVAGAPAAPLLRCYGESRAEFLASLRSDPAAA